MKPIIFSIVGIGIIIGLYKMRFIERVKNLVKQFEGEKLLPYQDEAGKWTIGVGHLIKENETHLMGGITEKESSDLFAADSKIATDAVSGLVKVPLTDGQKAALISLIFNIGAGNFSTSTLLKKLNSGDYAGAANEFRRWRYITKSGHKVESPGLLKRRLVEANIFIGNRSV